MANQFEDTFLHDVANYSGPNPMGAGTYGTYWQTTLNAQGDFRTTSLDNVANYSDANPMGSGTYGTLWTVTI